MSWTDAAIPAILALVGYGARELYRVAGVLQAMEQRFRDHDRRLEHLEKKVDD